jgi:hypothetical protein
MRKPEQPNRLRRESRMGIRATKALVYAAAMDQAKAHMRRAGRTMMDHEDADVMVAILDRIFHELGGPEGWMAMERE